MRVDEVTDALDGDSHKVSVSAFDYGGVLARRIVRQSGEFTMEQTALAWKFIADSQAVASFGITDGRTPTAQNRTRTFTVGQTVKDAIDSLAATENKVFRTQSPRRERQGGTDFLYGAQARGLSRASVSAGYANGVMVVGAQQETVIPGPPERRYPPPNPKYATNRQPGQQLYEATFNYPDVLTQPSVDEKAAWHLADAANQRAVWTVDLEPGVWTPAMKPGDISHLLVDSPPRMRNLDVPVRIEEISIKADANGANDVTLSVREEGGVAPTGQTRQRLRTNPVDDFAYYLAQFERRVTRLERT
jgi:hypothetical protein